MDPARHRIFIALIASRELQRAVALWREQHERLPVRWLTDKNLHVTIIPPWYATDAADAARELATIRGTVGPIEANFTRVDFGPSPREPRLIWTEGPTPRALGDLQRHVAAALDMPLEQRPLRLHLTLARFRPEDFASLPTQRLDERVLWHERFTSIALMESHLSRSGADYEVLSEVPL
jgi:RNA 2',3'-cyclic 3'-phosphodiesterase